MSARTPHRYVCEALIQAMDKLPKKWRIFIAAEVAGHFAESGVIKIGSADEMRLRREALALFVAMIAERGRI